jgi:methionyl-tRNA formyltransferase
MTSKIKLIFLGTDYFAAKVCESLILQSNYEISLIVTQPDFVNSIKKTTIFSEVKKIAINYQIPYLQPKKITEIITLIANSKLSFGILCSYGQIIPRELLEKITIINIHPSLLPL